MSFQPGANLYTQGFGSRPENVEVPHVDVRDPNSTDVLYPLAKRWLNRLTATEWVLGSFTSTAGVLTANWIILGGGSVALQTLTGDVGGAVSPTAGNINLLTGNGLTTTGDPGTSTITITRDDFPNSGTGTTVGATTANLITIPLGAVATTYAFEARIAGFESTTPAGVGYSIFGTLRTDGASATVIGTVDRITNEDPALNAANATIVASGNNAVIQVLGVAGLTINWRAFSLQTSVV